LVSDVEELKKDVEASKKRISKLETSLAEQKSTMLTWQTANLVFHGV